MRVRGLWFVRGRGELTARAGGDLVVRAVLAGACGERTGHRTIALQVTPERSTIADVTAP